MPKRPHEKRSKSPAGLRPTGITALDEILHGGLPVDAAVLVAGASGTGKTALCLQWLFAGYEQLAEPGLYISFTEPVHKVAHNLQGLTFFKKSYLNPLQIHLTDLRGILKGIGLEEEQAFQREDLRKIVETIRNMAEQMQAKRVVIDSITAMAYRLKDKSLIRDFIFELGNALAQLQTNVLMTSEVAGEGYSIFGVEEFIADGIVKLTHERTSQDTLTRKLEIVKMRALGYDSSSIHFRITGDGLVFFPRPPLELTYPVSDQRISTGIEGLDAMTNGGMYRGSVTILSGPSGTGKTNLALHFVLKGLEEGERVVYVSTEESHDHLLQNAASFGWNLAPYERTKKLTILTAYPDQYFPEEFLELVRGMVRERGATRLVFDSLSSLRNAYVPEVVHDFSKRLTASMKHEQVTTWLSVASEAFLGSESVTDIHLSTVADNIILLRYIEIQSELKHGLLLLKIRGSAHDKKLREFIFTPEGIQLSTSFSGYEGVMGGLARKVSISTEEQLHVLFLEMLGPMGERIFVEEKAKGLTQDRVAFMIKQLGNQRIISENRKEEFLDRTKSIFSTNI